MHRGYLSSAEQSLRRALALNAKSLAVLNNLGIVVAREGKPADAIPYYQQALKLRPDDPATKRNLALAYFKAQQYRSAWSLLEPLTANSPHDFQLLDLSGLTLFALDRYPEAARDLERGNQDDPADLERRAGLGKGDLRGEGNKE